MMCGMARPKGHTLSTEAWDDILRLSGLTLTLVAERADIPRPTLSSLLGGHHAASAPMAHKLAAAVRCNPATLFPSLRATSQDVAA